MAVTAGRHQVEVSATAGEGDMVGAALISAVREQVRRSSSMELVSAGPRMVLTVLTLDPDRGAVDRDAGSKATRTIYSVVVSFTTADGDRFLVDHTLGLCGSKRVDEVARNIIAELDHTLGNLDAAYERRQQYKTPHAPPP
ncbi:MAG TPA: hypothetical protein VHR45_09705 [Thermoanaerobaculia bacterium]|nr:hypothetical protein [Thermoanaerobaculia bacterium]